MARSFQYDEQGVPILDKEAIEKNAETVLHWGDSGSLSPQRPRSVDVLAIYSKLKKKGELRFQYRPLNTAGSQAKVLGQFCYGDPPTIILDAEHEASSLTARTRFTLAHELGHFVLHRHRKVHKKNELIDTEEDLPRHLYMPQQEEKDWVEWQANQFAGALLVPRKTLRRKLLLVQEGLDIRSRLGRVWVDDSRSSMTLFRQTLGILALFYSVSKKVVEIRLATLELLHDHRGGDGISSLGISAEEFFS